MRILGVALGVLILGIVFLDVLWTTLGKGSGPLTKRVTGHLWKGLFHLSRRWKGSRLLGAAGVAITLIALGLSILLLWVGWTLIFHGSATAVVSAQTGEPAGFWDRVYFTGYTIFTLGTGDYRPQGSFWQAITPIASVSGLFLVTLIITYLVPVVQAATHKRKLALRINSLGSSPQAILINAWNGHNVEALEQYLLTLSSDLAHVQQRHLSYPVLHYMHSGEQTWALALRVAALDEALTLLEMGLEGIPADLDTSVYRSTRQVIAEFLDTLNAAFIGPADEVPPLPTLEPLRAHGLPVVSETVFADRARTLDRRRRLLLGLVQNDGWEWEMLRYTSEKEQPTAAFHEYF